MQESKVAAIFLLGVAVGGTGAVWAVGTHLKQKYEQVIDTEVAQVKEHYRHIQTKEQYDSPEDMLADLHAEELEKKAVEDEVERIAAPYAVDTERAIPTKTGAEPSTRRNVFDYNQLSKTEGKVVADKDSILVIDFDEFDGDDEYSKNTLTYYQADNTLADDVDEVVTDVEALVGPNVLAHFDEATTVYLRNHKLRSDYEVILEKSSYDVIVGGRG